MRIWSLRSFTTALISLFVAAGLATSAVSQPRTVEGAGAELPFARSRDGIRDIYIISFGLFGPESVFASEAEKAAQILRERLQPDAQLLVRFNHKRGGIATSATLAKALRSAGQAMDPAKDILVVFLTSHGSPDGLEVVAGRRSETLSPRAFRSMLNASGARYRVVIISACYSGVFARALADRRTLVITAAAPDRPSFGCEDGPPGPILVMLSSTKLSAVRGGWMTLFVGPARSSPSENGSKASNLPDRKWLVALRSWRC